MQTPEMRLWDFISTFTSHLRPHQTDGYLYRAFLTGNAQYICGQLPCGLIARGDTDADSSILPICEGSTMRWLYLTHYTFGPYRQGETETPSTHPAMDLPQVTLIICGATAIYIWYKRYYAVSISDVPGPKNPSWICGIYISNKPRGHHLTDSGQDIGGGGSLKNLARSRGDFWNNTEPWFAGTGRLGFASSLVDAVLTLTLFSRKNACGSQTPRLSTIFSRVPVFCTRDHTLSGSELCQLWIKVLPGLLASSLSYII